MLDRDSATLSRGMSKDSYVSGFSGLLCSFFSLIDLPKVVATQVQKKKKMKCQTAKKKSFFLSSGKKSALKAVSKTV